jgi:dipeptidyl-peptidase-4
MNKFILFIALLLPFKLLSQTPDFAAAQKFDAPNLQKQVTRLQIIPFFLKKSNKFWFTVDQKEEGNKFDYYLVDLKTKQKTPLFDKDAITSSLKVLDPAAPKTATISYSSQFSKDESTVEVSYNNLKYDYNYNTKVLAKQATNPVREPARAIGNWSPNQKFVLYSLNHNLYLKSGSDTLAFKLSTDGALYFSFSIAEEHDFIDKPTATDAVWSADSQNFYVLRKDNRKAKTMAVINSMAKPRPIVNSYKYEMSDDKEVAQYEFYVGSVADHSLKKVNIARWPDQEVVVLNQQNIGNEVFLLRKKRSRDEVELCAVDLKTGKLRVVVNEVSKPFINPDLFNVSVLNKGTDILWWSDRTGWGQYYHYNNSGKLLNTITSGNWTAGKITAIDTAKRLLYFYGYGKETGRNPNYAFLYRTAIDGNTPPVLLTPEDANHNVYVAPSKTYFVDNFSRIDLAPKTVVREHSGKFITEVYAPDLKKLYEYGWKQPEQFTVKAKDGVTDLYGLMWKPFNFDPNKKYPIISQVYPGPFTETVWNDFTITDRYNNTSLAQVGFIVVVMGHRGGSPYRNATYYKFGHENLRDYALEDDKYGLEQLGERFKYIDLTKVGIFGHSGGGAMSTTALCTYPDFYKVAVSSSGNHDNRIYNRFWVETYNGFNVKIDLNESIAKNLKGHLLLVTGESDQNVNPAHTYRMVDALIKADKNFDLLVLPGQGHTYEEPYKTYFQKRLRSYFAQYLLGANIPTTGK